MEAQRYPISVRLIGVMHKEKSKVSADGVYTRFCHLMSLLYQDSNNIFDLICIFIFQMYMTSVLWSDQNDIVVYRSFRDFKKMHVSI